MGFTDFPPLKPFKPPVGLSSGVRQTLISVVSSHAVQAGILVVLASIPAGSMLKIRIQPPRDGSVLAVASSPGIDSPDSLDPSTVFELPPAKVQPDPDRPTTPPQHESASPQPAVPHSRSSLAVVPEDFSGQTWMESERGEIPIGVAEESESNRATRVEDLAVQLEPQRTATMERLDRSDATDPPSLTRPLESDRTAAVEKSIPRAASSRPSSASKVAMPFSSSVAGVQTDSVPRPTFNVEPEYPRELLAQGVEGLVKLRVTVSAEGKPGTIRVHQSSGYAEFDSAAIAAVRRWRFEAGRRNAIAVESTIVVPVRFQIER
ncbi:MAG: hypothetical protein RIS70_1973 [Planctomycetota bacterium]|jgi:TonB family protein